MKKILVPEEAYTGRNQTTDMVDCTSRVLPEAKMCIDTPYYKSEVLALWSRESTCRLDRG